MIGALAALGVVGVLFWAVWPSSEPSEDSAVQHGPTLKEQIAAVDVQLKELRIARRNGDLGPEGLNALSRLESKRAVLTAAQDAQEDN